MAKNTPLGAFADVLQVWDTAAAASGPIRVRFPALPAAVRYRQHAYDARRKKQRLLEEQIGKVPGYEPATPYDTFILYIEDDARRRRDPRLDAKARRDPTIPDPPDSEFFEVIFARRTTVQEIYDEAGNKIELAPPQNPPSPLDSFDFDLDDEDFA